MEVLLLLALRFQLRSAVSKLLCSLAALQSEEQDKPEERSKMFSHLGTNTGKSFLLQRETIREHELKPLFPFTTYFGLWQAEGSFAEGIVIISRQFPCAFHIFENTLHKAVDK